MKFLFEIRQREAVTLLVCLSFADRFARSEAVNGTGLFVASRITLRVRYKNEKTFQLPTSRPCGRTGGNVKGCKIFLLYEVTFIKANV